MFKSDFHHSDFKPARLVWRGFGAGLEAAAKITKEKEVVKKKESLKKELDVQQERDKAIKKLLTTKRGDIENFLKDDLGDDLDPNWDALGEGFLEIMGKDSDYEFLGHLQGMLYRKYPKLIEDVDVRNTGVGDKIFGPHTLGAIFLYLKLECDAKSDAPAFYTQFRDFEKFAPGRDVLLSMMFNKKKAVVSGSKMIAKSKGEIKEEVKAIEKLGLEHLWTKYFKALELVSSDALSDSAKFITDGGDGPARGEAYEILRDRFFIKLKKTVEANGEFDFDDLSQWVSAFEKAGLTSKEIRALGLKVGDESEDGEKEKGDSDGEVEEGGDESGVESSKRGPSHNKVVVGAMIKRFESEVSNPLENRYSVMAKDLVALMNHNKDSPDGVVMRSAELGFRVSNNTPLQNAFSRYREAHEHYHNLYKNHKEGFLEAEDEMNKAFKNSIEAVDKYYVALRTLNRGLEKEYKKEVRQIAKKYSLPSDLQVFKFNSKDGSFSIQELASALPDLMMERDSVAKSFIKEGVPEKTIAAKKDFLPFVKGGNAKERQAFLDRVWKEIKTGGKEPITEINRWILVHNRDRFNVEHRQLLKDIADQRRREEASLNDMPLNQLINVPAPRVS